MDKRVSVAIADDHPLYREGLADTIARRPELELIAQVADGAAALDAISRLAPDVALVDLDLPGLTGMEVLERLGDAGCATRVVVLSGHHDSEIVYAALACGAAGYLSKDSSGAEICETVEAVARGATVLGPDVQSAVAKEIRHRARGSSGMLSRREQQVLELIADGLSAPAIAERLELGTTTVKTHLQHIYEKLGVNERAAAVAEAIRRGVLR